MTTITNPDAALRAVRTFAAAVLEADVARRPIDPNVAHGLAEAVAILDESLTAGGKLPQEWGERRNARVGE